MEKSNIASRSWPISTDFYIQDIDNEIVDLLNDSSCDSHVKNVVLVLNSDGA